MSALVLTQDGVEVTRRYLPRREALKALATLEVGYRSSRQARTVKSLRRITTRLTVTTKAGRAVVLEVR